MVAIPLVPEVADGLALEDSNKSEYCPVDANESDSCPQKLANTSRWEDTKIKEQQAEFHGCLQYKVGEDNNVEPKAEVRYLLRSEGPDVGPYAGRGRRESVDADAEGCDEHCYHYEDVV